MTRNWGYRGETKLYSKEFAWLLSLAPGRKPLNPSNDRSVFVTHGGALTICVTRGACQGGGHVNRPTL